MVVARALGASRSSRVREAASSPVGLPAAAAAAATGERYSTANGLPVERRSEAAGGVGAWNWF